MSAKKEAKPVLPHHEQFSLCGSRLPYRQGKKLTAVKAYSINNESAHLLIFGVPSLDLRREVKELCLKFGRLKALCVMKDYAVEEFTETYHAHFDRIQPARIAKKMLDTKNFYGGSLHVCYAPELETVHETRDKLMQRKRDVTFRLTNIQREQSKDNIGCNLNVTSQIQSNVDVTSQIQSNVNVTSQIQSNVNVKSQIEANLNVNSTNLDCQFENNEIVNEIELNNKNGKLNMGENNLIYLNTNKNKRNRKEVAFNKRFKPYANVKDKNASSSEESIIKNDQEIVDCTSAEKEIISNINEALNYNKFGNEVIKKIELKPLNKIVFNLSKSSSQ